MLSRILLCCSLAVATMLVVAPDASACNTGGGGNVFSFAAPQQAFYAQPQAFVAPQAVAAYSAPVAFAAPQAAFFNARRTPLRNFAFGRRGFVAPGAAFVAPGFGPRAGFNAGFGRGFRGPRAGFQFGFGF